MTRHTPAPDAVPDVLTMSGRQLHRTFFDESEYAIYERIRNATYLAACRASATGRGPTDWTDHDLCEALRTHEVAPSVWSNEYVLSNYAHVISAVRALLAKYGAIPSDAALASARMEGEIRERERKAAYDALHKLASLTAVQRDRIDVAILRFAEANYAPIPAPPSPAAESVTLSDGSVVRGNVFREGTGWVSRTLTRSGESVFKGNWPLNEWQDLLKEPTDTGADFDAVKALALRLRGADQ